MLTASTTESDSVVRLTSINLSERVPLTDPGGFKSVLYGTFSAAEVRLAKLPIGELSHELTEAIEASGYEFVVLNLDRHSWLARNLAWLEALETTLDKRGVRLQVFGANNVVCHLGLPNRESAIEACVRVWEQKLLRHFRW